MAAPVDGIYRIETAMDSSLIWDVSNESRSNKANLMIFTQNEGISYAGNHQRFHLSTTGTHRQFKALHSGKAIEVFGKTSKPANGDNVSQYTPNGGANQMWVLQDTTSSTGAACHYIASAMGTGYVLDAEGAVRTPGANVMLREKWADPSAAKEHGDNQKWRLVRDSAYYPKWPVPANVGMATSKTGAAQKTVQITGGSGTLYPAWTCSGARYQMRYRWEGRFKGTDTWSGWNAWREPSGSTANGGWGDPWTNDLEDPSNGILKHFLPGVSVSLDAAYDRMNFQIEVMRFEPSSWWGELGTNVPVHGGSACGTVAVVRRPTVSVTEVAFAPDGLRVAYSSDFERGGNRVDALTISCSGRTLVSGFQANGLPAVGTLVVPFDQLAFVPEDGATCSVGFNFRTVDTGVWASASLAVAYDASHGLAINPAFSDAEGYALSVSLPGIEAGACYLQTEQDGRTRFVECAASGPGEFSVYPPFGKGYRLFLTARSGSSWGTKVVDRHAIAGARACIWNSAGGWCALDLDAKVVYSAERDHEAVQTNGRPRECVFLGEGFRGTVSARGVVVPELGLDHGGIAAFDALQGDGHAVFRTPGGERFDVSVVSVEHSLENSKKREVSVTMRERA